MEKHSVPGLRKGTALPSGLASASGCSVNWASGCANHAPLWPMLIPRHRKPIKKTASLEAGRERRSLGDRRSALSAAWLALPHVDPARNQGPGPAARPHPQECGVFRSRALAGWALCVPSGNRQIQWAQLPWERNTDGSRQGEDPAVAVKAMAAKLARLVYNMLRHGMEYVDRGMNSTNNNSESGASTLSPRTPRSSGSN